MGKGIGSSLDFRDSATARPDSPAAGQSSLFSRAGRFWTKRPTGHERLLPDVRYVRLISNAYSALSGTPVIDGVQTAVGDRVLVRHQGSLGGGSLPDNGVYEVSSGSWTRAADATSTADMAHAIFVATEGVENQGKPVYCRMMTGDTFSTVAKIFSALTPRIDRYDSLQFPGNPGRGTTAHNTDLNFLAVHDGVNWVAPKQPIYAQEAQPVGTLSASPPEGSLWYQPSTRITFIRALGQSGNSVDWRVVFDPAEWQAKLDAKDYWVAYATTAPITLSGTATNGGPTVDGGLVYAGDTVLAKDQADPRDNGVWTVQTGVWTRPSGWSATNANIAILGNAVKVLYGDANRGKTYHLPVGPEVTFSSAPGGAGSNISWSEITTGGSSFQATAPLAPTHKHLWFDTTIMQLKIWDKASGIWRFLSGIPAPGHQAQVLRSTASLTLTTTMTQVPGLSTTVQATGPTDEFEVVLVMDFAASTGSTAVLIGQLYVDATIVQTGQALFTATANNDRASVSQVYKVSGLSAGPHTLSVMAAKNANVGASNANAQHCTMAIKRLVNGDGGGATASPVTKLIATADQTFASGTFVPVTFGLVAIDVAQQADLANNRILIKYPGLYRLTAKVTFAVSTAAGLRHCRIMRNGTEVEGNRVPLAESNGITPVACDTVVALAVGDVITLQGYQGTTGSLSSSRNTENAVSLTAERVGVTPSLSGLLFKGSNPTATNYGALVNVPYATRFDPLQLWSTANNRFTIPVTGTYRITVQVKWDSTSRTVPSLIIRNGGVGVYGFNPGAATAFGGSSITWTENLLAGDTIAHNVQTAFTTQADSGADNNFMTIERVSDGQAVNPLTNLLATAFNNAPNNTAATTAAGWVQETEAASRLVTSFVAPVGGRVKITASADLSTNAANVLMKFGFKWSGPVTRDPLAHEIVSIYAAGSAARAAGDRSFIVSGLTPGATYTLTSSVAYENTNGNGGVASRAVIVEAI